MRHGYEAITIKIETEDKRALERRCLEHPNYGRYNGPKSYADLVRTAIKAFLAPPPASTSTPAIAGPKAAKRPSDEPFSFYVHHRRKGTEHATTCGLSGVADEALTSHAPNATCPACLRVVKNNERALAAPSRTKSAPKKAAKRRTRR